MSQERELELQRDESWDYERPEVRGPVKAARVVVSVAFRRDDFERLGNYADHVGKRISQVIREAALEKTTGWGAILVYASDNWGVYGWSAQKPPFTQATGSRIDPPVMIPATTH